MQPAYPESQIHAQKRGYYSDLTVSTAAHSYTRLNVLGQILASQIASVVESGNLGKLLWCDSLKQDTDDLISEKFNTHQIHVIDDSYLTCAHT